VYFFADTPITFGVCSMLVKTKEHFDTDVAMYTKHFAPGLQSAAAPSTEWTSIKGDVYDRSPRPGHKVIRIYVTPYQMTLHICIISSFLSGHRVDDHYSLGRCECVWPVAKEVGVDHCNGLKYDSVIKVAFPLRATKNQERK
jgi:hypothetical protein